MGRESRAHRATHESPPRATRRILRLRQLRKSIDMTQAELARRVGLDRTSIQSIEAGHSNPSLPKAIDIAAVFKTPVEEVFSYVEVPA
jgi:putative transcriptional regulator